MRLDDALAQLLLWMCCLRLKQEADGVPAPPRRIQERAKLLQVRWAQLCQSTQYTCKWPGQIPWDFLV